MVYSELEENVKKAKHLRVNNRLEGTKRQVVFYMYAEIIDGIERGVFYKKASAARIELFEIKHLNNLIYVYTKHVASQRIKCFPCYKSEFGEDVEAIESAMKLVGLEMEKNIVYLVGTKKEEPK